jgi:hypothetical protein
MFSLLRSSLMTPGIFLVLTASAAMAQSAPPTTQPSQQPIADTQIAPRGSGLSSPNPKPSSSPAPAPIVTPASVTSPSPAAPTTPPTTPVVPSNRQSTILLPGTSIRPLLGRLDNVPVFNSNSPEMVRTEGILLSTFSPTGKRFPAAHLNYPLKGRFDIFAHHITQLDRPNAVTTLYLGILIHNPGTETVSVSLPQGATYLSTPEAPFRSLPSLVDNPTGFVFSGPGSRVMNHVLRGRRQLVFPSQLVLPPGASQMLVNLPIPLPRRNGARPVAPQIQQIQPLQELMGGAQPFFPIIEDAPPMMGARAPSSNGRSLLAYLDSSGPVHVASMAMYSRIDQYGAERPPSLTDWQNLVMNGNLIAPRDKPPSPMELVNVNTPGSRFFYSRVAGVSRGSQWLARLTDPTGGDKLTIPLPGHAISYGISTLHRGTLGTGQVQSAPMLARYPDTAYYSHGNYGVRYTLTLPLYNPTPQLQAVTVKVQTPLKDDDGRSASLNFLERPTSKVFFRGTVRVNYNGDDGVLYSRFVHLVQRQGQRGEPIVLLNLQPGERRQVEVDFLYPPDATPPQVLTVATQVVANSLTSRNP